MFFWRAVFSFWIGIFKFWFSWWANLGKFWLWLMGFAVAARTATGQEAIEKPSSLLEIQDFGPNPGQLRCWIHVPPNLAKGAPLVVVLHGSTQSAAGYATGAGWVALANRHGFAVLCPEQLKSNNPTRSFNWFEPKDCARDGGEAASIAQMLRHTVKTRDLDGQRVYVTGLSSGGAMTAIMLATYPELFLAGAVICGLPYGAATSGMQALWVMFKGSSLSAAAWGNKVRAASRASAWPSISIWQGLEDRVVNPQLASALVSQWTNVHGLSEGSGKATSSSVRSDQVWRDANGVERVTYHTIASMGHGTPLKVSGDPADGTAAPYLLDVGIASSQEIARSWGLAVPAATTLPAR